MLVLQFFFEASHIHTRDTTRKKVWRVSDAVCYIHVGTTSKQGVCLSSHVRIFHIYWPSTFGLASLSTNSLFSSQSGRVISKPSVTRA